MRRKTIPRPGAAADGAQDTMARLRALAEHPGAPGTPHVPSDLMSLHPDAELLRLCEAVIHNRRQQRAIIDEPSPRRSGLIWTAPPPDLDKLRNRCAELRKLSDDGAQLMRRAGKLPAQTLAGLYAKVMICRASSSGSPMLAKSLASDMIALRPIVWPALAREDGR